MIMNRILYPFFLFVSFLLLSCNRTPEGVLDRKQMEEVLLDVHLAEGVMEERGQDFRSQESRQAVMKGVLEKHHITQTQFDSSMGWYGAHLDQYMKVYSRVIKQLEERNLVAKEVLLAYEKSLLTPFGDSVDIWRFSKQLILDPALLTTSRDFEIRIDSNFKEKDTIGWSMRFVNIPADSIAKTRVTLGLRSQGKILQLEEQFVSHEGELTLGFRSDKYTRGGDLFANITIIPVRDSLLMPVYIEHFTMLRQRNRIPEIVADSAAISGDSIAVSGDSIAAGVADSIAGAKKEMLQPDTLQEQQIKQ